MARIKLPSKRVLINKGSYKGYIGWISQRLNKRKELEIIIDANNDKIYLPKDDLIFLDENTGKILKVQPKEEKDIFDEEEDKQLQTEEQVHLLAFPKEKYIQDLEPEYQPTFEQLLNIHSKQYDAVGVTIKRIVNTMDVVQNLLKLSWNYTEIESHAVALYDLLKEIGDKQRIDVFGMTNITLFVLAYIFVYMNIQDIYFAATYPECPRANNRDPSELFCIAKKFKLIDTSTPLDVFKINIDLLVKEIKRPLKTTLKQIIKPDIGYEEMNDLAKIADKINTVQNILEFSWNNTEIAIHAESLYNLLKEISDKRKINIFTDFSEVALFVLAYIFIYMNMQDIYFSVTYSGCPKADNSNPSELFCIAKKFDIIDSKIPLSVFKNNIKILSEELKDYTFKIALPRIEKLSLEQLGVGEHIIPSIKRPITEPSELMIIKKINDRIEKTKNANIKEFLEYFKSHFSYFAKNETKLFKLKNEYKERIRNVDILFDTIKGYINEYKKNKALFKIVKLDTDNLAKNKLVSKIKYNKMKLITKERLEKQIDKEMADENYELRQNFKNNMDKWLNPVKINELLNHFESKESKVILPLIEKYKLILKRLIEQPKTKQRLNGNGNGKGKTKYDITARQIVKPKKLTKERKKEIGLSPRSSRSPRSSSSSRSSSMSTKS